MATIATEARTAKLVGRKTLFSLVCRELGILVLALAALMLVGRSAPALAGDAGDLADDPLLAEFDEGCDEPDGFPDPLERMNRGTLRLNQGLDRWIFNPITRTYRFIVPEPARYALRRVVANLNAPAVLVNDVLQLELKDAGVTVTRFVLNTTVGVAGVFDPASRLGLPGHTADFGQTLALAGVGSGPYLVLPVLGPTTVRDGAGSLVDFLFRPTTYVLGPADQLFYTTAYSGSSGIATREEHADALRVLEESSVDYYAALRNAYYQNRTAEIWSRSEQGGNDEPETAVSASTRPGPELAATPPGTAPSLLYTAHR